MDDKKKKYVIPKAEIVDFVNEDIITTSGLEEAATAGWDITEGEDY